MDVIDRINICITKAGISGAKLCQAIGLSSGVYSQWCSGTTKPSKKNVAKIADYFGVSVEYLLYGKEETAAPEGSGLTDAQRQLLALIPDMTPAETAVLLAAAKAQLDSRRSQDAE